MLGPTTLIRSQYGVYLSNLARGNAGASLINATLIDEFAEFQCPNGLVLCLATILPIFPVRQPTGASLPPPSPRVIIA